VFSVLLLAFFLPACDDDYEGEHDRDYRRADKTPSGFHVQFDDLGTLSTGLMTKAEIYRLFDEAFLAAGDIFEVKNGVPLQSFLSAPHDHRIVFRIIDHWHYFSPYNGWVPGEAFGRETILLSFWTQRLKPFGQVTNPWTLWTNPTGQTYVGAFPGAGSFTPLIVHEMGHVFFGPQFGH
jgi:hypothetical protein